MSSSFLPSVVDFSRRFAKTIALFAFVVSLGLGWYVEGHIRINTDINQLLSDDLGWRKREKMIAAAFPQKSDNLIIVIDADNPDEADSVAAALAAKLTAMPDKFSYVARPDALPFFRTNGLLYLSKEDLGAALDQIAQAQPMMGVMNSDPSLRGFFGTIGLMTQGVQAGAVDMTQIEKPFQSLAASINAAADGKDLPMEWQQMGMSFGGNPARMLRRFIITKPTLDYSDLQPGQNATNAVRQAIGELDAPAGVHIRLTGSVPLNDEEFASVAQGAGLATTLSGVLVLGLLFLAMRSWRIVLPIALTLTMGLITSTAFATVAVGSLNLISVAFAVMFIGIAVDFGIQFGVRYRDQHHQEPDHARALRHTAVVIAVPLAMAAASTALGFLAFIPTDYRGVSELGIIAGAGMIIAFILNITLLPALMTLTRPKAEAEHVGYHSLAPLNHFLISRRRVLLAIILVIAVAGLVLASRVHFDFDPLDLKDPHSESVTTMMEAMQDPDSDAYAAQLLVPNQEEAMKESTDLAKLPEVDHTMTLASFVPEDQDKKLAMIADTTALLTPTLALPRVPAPSDAENLVALRKSAILLHRGDNVPALKNLADAIDNLVAHGTPENLQRAQENIVVPMQAKMTSVESITQVHAVTLDDIPQELRDDWVTKDGRWLVEIFPKRGADNNPRDPAMLNKFIDAVQNAAPDVIGTPVSIRESGRTIVGAFVHAGIYGVLSIALLSFLVLRNLRNVFIMLAPLVLAGILTLATITMMGLPLNFANIIALPLLLSLGVSYAVYFVFYAQSGRHDFLQSSMARAVLFSAATVLVAFATLCFSSHPGTRGMGQLLTIALLYCLICTFLMLPVLLGNDREDKRL